MKLECKRCGHKWNYTGKKEYPAYVSCPNCYNKVQVKEDGEGEQQI